MATLSRITGPPKHEGVDWHQGRTPPQKVKPLDGENHLDIRTAGKKQTFGWLKHAKTP